MAYPPVLPTTGFKLEGINTYIVWGTDGFESNSLSGYIVVSVRDSQRVELPIIENGSGLTAYQIILTDGEDYEVEVVENTNVTPPAAGSILTLVSAYFTNSQTFLCVNSSTQFARKQEGRRTLTAKSYTLFSPS